MSVREMAWVYDHSPYEAGAFAVHLAIADSVSDMHGHRFWLTQGELARKVRLGRQRVNVIIGIMVADGFLELLEPGGGRGKPGVYRFHMPAKSVAPHDSNSPILSHLAQETVASGDTPVIYDPKEPKELIPSVRSAELSLPEPVDNWQDLEDVRAEVLRLNQPELLDLAFWRRVEALTDGTQVFYLNELRKYALWLEATVPGKRRKDRKRQFMNWIRTAVARDQYREKVSAFEGRPRNA